MGGKGCALQEGQKLGCVWGGFLENLKYMRDEGQGTKAEWEKEERLEGKVDGISLKTPHRLLAPTPR